MSKTNSEDEDETLVTQKSTESDQKSSENNVSKINSEGETLVTQKLTESDQKSNPKPVAKQSVRVKRKITVHNQDEKTKKICFNYGRRKGPGFLKNRQEC